MPTPRPLGPAARNLLAQITSGALLEQVLLDLVDSLDQLTNPELDVVLAALGRRWQSEREAAPAPTPPLDRPQAN